MDGGIRYFSGSTTKVFFSGRTTNVKVTPPPLELFGSWGFGNFFSIKSVFSFLIGSGGRTTKNPWEGVFPFRSTSIKKSQFTEIQ